VHTNVKDWFIPHRSVRASVPKADELLDWVWGEWLWWDFG